MRTLIETNYRLFEKTTVVLILIFTLVRFSVAGQTTAPNSLNTPATTTPAQLDPVIVNPDTGNPNQTAPLSTTPQS